MRTLVGSVPVASVLVAGAWLVLTIAMVMMFLHSRADRGSSCRAALIPAYVPARELARLAHGPSRPRMVIVNPDSGPGARRDHAYIAAVSRLQAVGVRVLGYVPTGYGWRPLQSVLDDVDRYQRWYDVDGLFFDEAASAAGLVPYYAAMARAARGQSRRLVVLNPGVIPAPGYFDVADVVVTFEGDHEDYVAAMRETPRWLRRHHAHAAHLIYDATRADASNALESAAADYVYATSGTLPNPWQTLPPYLDDEVEALAACG
jgi:hypothetical protein